MLLTLICVAVMHPLLNPEGVIGTLKVTLKDHHSFCVVQKETSMHVAYNHVNPSARIVQSSQCGVAQDRLCSMPHLYLSYHSYLYVSYDFS